MICEHFFSQYFSLNIYLSTFQSRPYYLHVHLCYFYLFMEGYCFIFQLQRVVQMDEKVARAMSSNQPYSTFSLRRTKTTNHMSLRNFNLTRDWIVYILTAGNLFSSRDLKTFGWHMYNILLKFNLWVRIKS